MSLTTDRSDHVRHLLTHSLAMTFRLILMEHNQNLYASRKPDSSIYLLCYRRYYEVGDTLILILLCTLEVLLTIPFSPWVVSKGISE